MAVPKYKPSKSRTRRRKAMNMKITAPNLVPCGNCGNLILSHRVCGKCGFYGGKQIFDAEEMS